MVFNSLPFFLAGYILILKMAIEKVVKNYRIVHQKFKPMKYMRLLQEQFPADITNGVYWHLAPEHKSDGEYDLPAKTDRRLWAEESVQPGFQCNAMADFAEDMVK